MSGAVVIPAAAEAAERLAQGLGQRQRALGFMVEVHQHATCDGAVRVALHDALAHRNGGGTEALHASFHPCFLAEVELCLEVDFHPREHESGVFSGFSECLPDHVRATLLEPAHHRHIVDVAEHVGLADAGADADLEAHGLNSRRVAAVE